MKLDSVSKIGVVGAGMIGNSLAVLATGHGYPTVCVDNRVEMFPEFKKGYDASFRQMIDQGVMLEDQLAICEKYLKYSADLVDLAHCEIIFECVTENKDLKHEIYAKIEELCPKVRAICSVSSSIVPDILAEKATKYKDRIIVTHPFNPAHMVPFFECCGGSATDPAVYEFVREVLEALDRKPVFLKKPAPGFIGNRLQFALWREALNLVDSGIADPRDVDTCLNYSFCPRYTSIGIFEHFDNGDLTLNQHTCNVVFPTLSNIAEAPPSITDRVARGDLGAKTGQGFYDWRDVDMDAYRKRVNAPYWRFINWDMPKE